MLEIYTIFGCYTYIQNQLRNMLDFKTYFEIWNKRPKWPEISSNEIVKLEKRHEKEKYNKLIKDVPIKIYSYNLK